MIPAILGLTAAWHALAAWHFGITPERTMARTTLDRPVGLIPTELLRFLGGLNAALLVLALLACALPDARFVAVITLAVANASQAVQDFRVMRLGHVRGAMFRQILVGDCLFTVANGVAAVVLWR